MHLTSDGVMLRAGIAGAPEYIEAGPMTDCIGLYAYRLYPPDGRISRVVTREGHPALACLLQFVVELPTLHGGSSVTHVHARMYDRYGFLTRIPFPRIESPDYDAPHSPTPESFALFKRMHHPVALDFLTEYVYDSASDQFFDSDGQQVEPLVMLDRAYELHWKTYRRVFAWRWRLGSLNRMIVFRAVWKGQDLCSWLLFKFYDLEPATPRDRGLNPMHQHWPSEFQRARQPDQPLSNFFGFPSSRKGFAVAMILLALLFAVGYWTLPRWSILRAVYQNDALTTAALLLGFVVIDLVVPWSLIYVVCGLSWLRPRVMFFERKVPVAGRRRR